MRSIIPDFGVVLSDARGMITTQWFRFFARMALLIPSAVIKATATLDFPNTAANAVSDLTVAVPGALDGDIVTIGVPATSVPAGGSYSAWVSATDVVTVRFANNTAVAQNPASGDFFVVVTRY